MKITTLWLPLSAKNQRQNNGGENTKEDHAENNGGASEAKIRDEASNEAITRVFLQRNKAILQGRLVQARYRPLKPTQTKKHTRQCAQKLN